MAIQLPGNLAIANFLEVEIPDFVECLAGSALPVDNVQMPVDRITVFQILITEKVKTMIANLVRLAHDPRNLAGQPLTQNLQDRPDHFRPKEKVGVFGSSRPRFICDEA